MTRFMKTLAISATAAALAAPAALGQPDEFVQGVTDFPRTMTSEQFVPWVTDFGKSTASRAIVSPAEPAATTVLVERGFGWAAAGIGAATGVALGALGLASVVAVRRRVSGSHA